MENGFLAGRIESHHTWPVASRPRKWTKFLNENWSSYSWAKEQPIPSRQLVFHWMKEMNRYIQEGYGLAVLAFVMMGASTVLSL